jgi:O-antigen biosynthesis protein WbqL
MNRACVEIEFRECKSMDQLVSACDPVKLITDAGRSVAGSLPWLLSSPPPEQIRPTLALKADAPALGLAAVSQCWVFGRMYLGDTEHVYCSDQIFPLYVGQWAKESRNDATSLDLSGYQPRQVDGCVVIISHFNAPVYGHWLLECLPKLLYLKRIFACLPEFRIVVPARSPGFISAWIRHAMPSVEVLEFDRDKEYLICEKVLLPLSLCSTAYVFHPILGEMIDTLIGSQGAPSELLYLTREKDSWYRFMTNREEIEGIARNAGLRLVSPETLAISDQVALFARARFLVGEFGSALHNAIFSPPGTLVLGLNWINALQSRIGQLRRQQCAFLLPSDNAPLLFDNTIKAKRGYHIDPSHFERAIEEILGRWSEVGISAPSR